MDINELMETTFAGWSLLDWARLLGIAALVALALRLLRFGLTRIARRIAEKTRTRADDWIAVVLRGTRSFFLIAAGLYLARAFLEMQGPAVPWINRIIALSLLVQIGLWGGDLIRWWLEDYGKDQAEVDQARLTAMRALGLGGRLLLWSILFVLALENLGVDITALVTGLGITGIAVALAVQNVLKDVLAYVSILVDQPFVIGDFLTVGSEMGTVEDIGVKSTRLRSLSGEQLIFSNTDLLGSRIRNYKRMDERRALFSVGVVYGTRTEKLQAIPALLREVVEAQEDIRFDRAHLKGFADSAITYEVVYYVLRPDYATFMDVQQAINLSIYRRFETEGIEFAYPTQTLHIASLPGAATAP